MAQEMIKLSTGDDSTLGTYRRYTVAMFGEESKAVEFLDKKIAVESENAMVVTDEQQMLYLLYSIDAG